MTTPEMRKRASEFEKEQTKAEKEMLRDRAKRVKAEGYKSESEYFANTNPFRNSAAKTKALKKKIHSLNPAALDERQKGYKNNKH